jgi:D-beta-D-heptose 7-phosphate kinase/D-beta-D-heptose 1-phosphate adenosyltransferase
MIAPMKASPLQALKRKIVSQKEAVRIASKLRKRGLVIVTTNGTFDLLHSGHVDSLVRAKSLGDVLMVGVNSDASVRRYKGPTRPIVEAKERALMVAALECVDYVFIFSSDTPIPWIHTLRPHIHAKGSDRAIEQIVEKTAVDHVGGKVILLPHTERRSTTKLIERIRNGQRSKKPESR